MARLQTEMMCVFLMLMLSGVSDGNTCICDATKSITCHGVQGEPLYLQVIPNATGYRLILKEITQNGASTIFRYKRNQILFFNETLSSSLKQRLHFTAMNGTISINPATKGDSGTYQVEIINDDKGMETPVYVIRASACLGVILLCGAVGVLCVCQRRTHTHKPGQTTKCNET
ncbi:uncharacterized protein LOC121695049 isoform X2 [Alosa sapidissima]|uniref:uncharacterized protein LOC121695049 isoform X2 n=1 Tax=Alosa sapidissima TaxID=34773 RepID=UPI001C08B627|nr:uncharacterized protein LOC121695049 isoform X2 [Alosa sapidissima]